ncbi:MAG: hypothetical protein HYU67_07225 [Flavobacteriia bacterium]|nr:hypothetical protein [Flavobacteriia bacterium]
MFSQIQKSAKDKILLKNSYLYLFSVLICLLWYVNIYINQELPPDVGDGIMHFFISQASWHDSNLFFHHWGKPLFILLSSPFSQFGFNGMFVFQLLVFLLNCFFAFLIFKKSNVKSYLIILFPFFLALTKDYNETVFSGLTETLFNLFLIINAYLYINNKFLMFAACISFTPFLRSEGQLVVVLATLLLLFHKKYKFIPLLLLGFLIYSLLGGLFYNGFWWYFTENPYRFNNNIYGHGTWHHYFLSYKNYLGNQGLFLFCFVVIFFHKIYSKCSIDEKVLYFFSFLFFIGVLISHSYFWAMGKNGSMGLTRIATQGMPLFVLCNLIFLSKLKVDFFKSNFLIKNTLLVLFVLIPVFFLFKNKKFPIIASDFDSRIIESVQFLKKNSQYNKIYYHHPLIPFLFKVNPLINQKRFVSFPYINVNNNLIDDIKVGDVFIYDSHFSPLEGGININHLLKINSFPVVATFKSSNGFEIYGITIFQKQLNNEVKLIEKKEELFKDKNVNSNKEFINLMSFLKNIYDRKVHFTLSKTKTKNVFAVCTDSDAINYQAIELFNKDSVSFYLQNQKEYSFYIWNPNKKNISLKNMSLILKYNLFPTLKKK